MAAELFDPFEVVREEVQESVGRAEALAASFADPDDPWRQQGPSHGLPPTAGTEPRSKLEALLRSLDSDLDNLRDALSSIEARRDRYATTDDELPNTVGHGKLAVSVRPSEECVIHHRALFH